MSEKYAQIPMESKVSSKFNSRKSLHKMFAGFGTVFLMNLAISYTVFVYARLVTNDDHRQDMRMVALMFFMVALFTLFLAVEKIVFLGLFDNKRKQQKDVAVCVPTVTWTRRIRPAISNDPSALAARAERLRDFRQLIRDAYELDPTQKLYAETFSDCSAVRKGEAATLPHAAPAVIKADKASKESVEKQYPLLLATDYQQGRSNKTVADL